ncbi:hypothetical protein BVX97_05175 [bacterium E08(2017)]|nr:hypothetical protein BVX97_05175 [bacterium E08(2017)]
MKTKYITTLIATVILLTTFVEISSAQNSASIGAKYRQMHSAFAELPYDDGDISIGLSYDKHSSESCIQFAVDYAWELNGIPTADYIITPQMNILWKDNAWFGGVGLLSSFIEDEQLGSDWTDLYWQLLFGLKIPAFGTSMDLGIHYEFDDWGEIGEFDWEDLQYGIWLNKAL